MTLIPMLLKEMEQEAQTTRKMLQRLPEDKYNWKPHPKSMTLQSLATHVAELPGWVTMTLATDELDFAKNKYTPEVINNNEELLAYFEKNLASGKESLENAKDEDLKPNWTLRNGDEYIDVDTKGEVLRMAYCQTVHHRAQLGVYLQFRLLVIKG
jgi:uncharacterized damage-inducible protein DinB